MNIKHLAPDARKVSDILVAVAQARGCSTPEQIAEFLNPAPEIRNPFASLLPEYEAARDRIAHALAMDETICIYGDYDADGITSTAQMYTLLKTAGATVRWFIPSRFSSGYGLTTLGVSKCFETYAPKLIIAVDCGSNSVEQVRWLKNKGCDSIIIDHHTPNVAHPGSIACLNPKNFLPAAQELSILSAAGLVYLFNECLAVDFNLGASWDRIRPAMTILAGLGSTADVMPLIGLNRSIVKKAIALANKPEYMALMPGLKALAVVSGTSEVTATTFGFEWGPRLNACGRLNDAFVAVSMLLADNDADAEFFAKACNKANTERRAKTDSICTEALAQAEEIIKKNPNTKVLVLAHHTWHPGIVGIVASRVKDKFNRPTIVLGASEEEPRILKGSGRSFDAFDIGGAIVKSREAKIIIEGGGHFMACGLKVDALNLQRFAEFVDACCDAPISAFQPCHEIIGNVTALMPSQWIKALETLAPFGAGNPTPCFIGNDMRLVQTPFTRSTKGEDGVERPFVMIGNFRCEGRIISQLSEQGSLKFDWFDVEMARKKWILNEKFTLIVQISCRKPDPKYNRTEPFYNYRVVNCEAKAKSVEIVQPCSVEIPCHTPAFAHAA